MTLFDPDRYSPYTSPETIHIAMEFDHELRVMMCDHPQWNYAPGPEGWFEVTFGERTAICREMICVDCKAMSFMGPLFPVDEDDEQ